MVFVAELGDKTQLVALSLATRHPAAFVIGAMAVAYTLVQGVAAALGGALGAALPTRAVSIASAVLFFAFAVWTLLEDDEDELAEAATARGFLAVVVALCVAELGDKSMLAGATVAADRGALGAWIGATAGELTAGILAVVAGRTVGTRISDRATRIVAAVLFAGFGVLLLVDAFV